MPCFKGLAVSIHTPDGPLPEYAVQRQSRLSRIASYIPVPPPRMPDASAPEQSTFAISITLLTPGQKVPYTDVPTPGNPDPKPRLVGPAGQSGKRTGGTIAPYEPMTASPAETVAAYVYFDGRQKEEVATLLRRSEETWVNSRWVGVPESEGGGLAEREFLFREVGLERWLTGLDLQGGDAAARIEKRRRRIEGRRKRRERAQNNMEDEGAGDDGKADAKAEKDKDGSQSDSVESDSDDDPIPETAGQIKVAFFRVLASGEIKRGEYSPQFDAHDDDDEQGDQADAADVDHTTSFAKPKTLDPKSISTQTVTGIDPTDQPYATVTFLYRGERQLQKMGILPKPNEKEAALAKRKSQPDFTHLGPLKPGGAAGFVHFRDRPRRRSKKSGRGSGSDSDMETDDDGGPSILDTVEANERRDSGLSPDDGQSGELAEGVRQIKLKRQHSAEPLSASSSNQATPGPGAASTPPAKARATTPPPATVSAAATPDQNEQSRQKADGKSAATPGSGTAPDASDIVGSPLKKQRASVSGATEAEMMRRRLVAGAAANIGQLLDEAAPASAAEKPTAGSAGGEAAKGAEMGTTQVAKGTDRGQDKPAAPAADGGMEEEL